jgi:hypothetical protein
MSGESLWAAFRGKQGIPAASKNKAMEKLRERLSAVPESHPSAYRLRCFKKAVDAL